MPKKRLKRSSHSHVPSHIGFGIIALVVLAIGLIVVTQYNTSNQTETVESHAAAAKTPLKKPAPKKPIPMVTVTKQCISMTTTGGCDYYQTTTTTVNIKTPCLSRDTSGNCTYYQGTTQKTSVWTPTPPKPKSCHNVWRCVIRERCYPVQVCS